MSEKNKKPTKKNKKEALQNKEQKEEPIAEETVTEPEKKSTEEPHENELRKAKDKYLRLYSEFENFRRRTSKEKLDLISTANKDLMTAILPVVDDLHRATEASNKTKDIKPFKEGIVLIQNKLNNTLTNRGLKKIEVKIGALFNPDEHEAITQIPTDKNQEGKIVDIIEAGYMLEETVIRFAKVVVGAKKIL